MTEAVTLFVQAHKAAEIANRDWLRIAPIVRDWPARQRYLARMRETEDTMGEALGLLYELVGASRCSN